MSEAAHELLVSCDSHVHFTDDWVKARLPERLKPRWVVPMHYRTPRIGFLDTADDFLEKMPHVERLSETGFDTDAFAGEDGPRAVVPAAP